MLGREFGWVSGRTGAKKVECMYSSYSLAVQGFLQIVQCYSKTQVYFRNPDGTDGHITILKS